MCSAFYKGHMTDVTMLYHDFSNGHERSWKSTVPHHFNALNNTPTICIFIFIQIISVNTFPNHHWGNVPGSFFIVVSTLQIFQQRTFAGRPVLSFHHPPLFLGLLDFEKISYRWYLLFEKYHTMILRNIINI